MGESILQLRQIRKSFDNTEVLKGIDLEAGQGEFITLLGASGCGKTTTLRIIAGLELPDAGQVILEGQDITNREPNKRDVNTVFQNYALFPHMNVSDNVGYGLKIRKVPKAEIERKVEQALRLVQLEEYGKRMPDQLSGGQKQRIAIARAVINEPKVLLLDEPLGALDLKLRRQMQLELKRLQKRLGITFIYITHDQEEAINMSDRIGVMHEGVLEQLGTPNEVYYQPKTSYVADFVGNANILRLGGETFAIRSENILMNGETVCTREAVVVEKSFAGGQLRILFRLPDGQTLTASRYGIDNDLQPGQQVRIGWEEPHAVKVIDNDKDENHKYQPQEKRECRTDDPYVCVHDSVCGTADPVSVSVKLFTESTGLGCGLYVHARQLQKNIGTAVSGYFLAVSEAGIYRHLFRGADRISVRLFHGKNERCLEAQDAVAHYDPFLDQCADPPVRLDYCLSQQWCTG